MNNPCDDCFANGCCNSKGACGLFQEYLYFRKRLKEIEIRMKKRHNCLNCTKFNRDENTCTKFDTEIFPETNYSQEYTCFEGDDKS